MTYYVGVLDGGGEVWGVRIPDVPGCVGGGKTPEAAIADAADALRDVLARKREGGFAARQPSSLSEIVASGEIGEGESAVMVPLLLDAGRRCAPTSASTRPCSTRLTPPRRSADLAARRSSPAPRARRSWRGRSELVDGRSSVRVRYTLPEGTAWTGRQRTTEPEVGRRGARGRIPPTHGGVAIYWSLPPC